MKTLRTKKDIIIPAGTELIQSPLSRSYGEPHLDATVQVGVDGYGTFTLLLEEGREEGLIEEHED